MHVLAWRRGSLALRALYFWCALFSPHNGSRRAIGLHVIPQNLTHPSHPSPSLIAAWPQSGARSAEDCSFPTPFHWPPRCQVGSVKPSWGLWEEPKLCLTLKVCCQTMIVSGVDRFSLPPLSRRPTWTRLDSRGNRDEQWDDDCMSPSMRVFCLRRGSCAYDWGCELTVGGGGESVCVL